MRYLLSRYLFLPNIFIRSDLKDVNIFTVFAKVKDSGGSTEIFLINFLPYPTALNMNRFAQHLLPIHLLLILQKLP